MGALKLYFKIKHDVQNDSELPLAKAELETLLGIEVKDVVNPLDLFVEGPLRPMYTPTPPRLQDWLTWHAYPGSVQGFYAEVEPKRLSPLLRVAYFREFYVAADAEEVPASSIRKLMPEITTNPDPSGPAEQELAPFARLFMLDGHWALRVVPLQTMYEFSDFVCRLANSVSDVERMFNAGVAHLQRGIYRPYYAESARLFKTIEDFMDDRRAPQLYLTHWFLGIHGKFFPRMIRAAMNAVGLREGDLVLDPFTGCGTLNVEASLMGIRSVGVEINPLLAAVSRVKVRALSFDVEETRRRIEKLESIIRASLEEGAGSKKQTTLLDAEEEIALADPSKVSVYLPDRIRNKVKRDSFEAVKTILAAIEEFEDPDFRDFCKVPLMYWMRSMLTKQDPQKIVKTYLDHLWRMYYALHFLKLFRESVAPLEPVPAKILVGDSTELRSVLEQGAPEELSEGFDAVVTSPPYMTAIDYVGDQLYALYVLGFTRDHLEIDKKTLGSTRAVEDQSLQITRGGSAFMELPESIRAFIGRVYQHRRKHASALFKYFHGLLRSFRELREVVKPGGRIVWIIGKQQVMKLDDTKVTVPVAKMMVELGQAAGLKYTRTIHVELAKSSERGAIPTESLIFFENP